MSVLSITILLKNGKKEEPLNSRKMQVWDYNILVLYKAVEARNISLDARTKDFTCEWIYVNVAGMSGIL